MELNREAEKKANCGLFDRVFFSFFLFEVNCWRRSLEITIQMQIVNRYFQIEGKKRVFIRKTRTGSFDLLFFEK